MKRFLILLACAAWGQVTHQHHPPSSDEYAKVLEDPARDAWQKPQDAVTALDLKPEETIADIGAGTGYFARRFAPHAGKVYAMDLHAYMLTAGGQDCPPSLPILLAPP